MFINKTLLLLAITLIFIIQLSFSDDLTSDNYFEFSSGIEQTASFTHTQTVLDTNNPVKNWYYIGPGSMISIPFNFIFKVNLHYALGFNMSVELYHLEADFYSDTGYNQDNHYVYYRFSDAPQISVIPDINYKFNLVNKFISGNNSFISEIGVKFRLTILNSIIIYGDFNYDKLYIGPSAFFGYEVKTSKEFAFVIGGFFDIDFRNRVLYKRDLYLDSNGYQRYNNITEINVLEYYLYTGLSVRFLGYHQKPFKK